MISSNPRLISAFRKLQGRTALIPYIAAGDPSPQATPELMHALVQAGADVIELGVPFSDPMADGPVIQRAAERAIAQGVGLRKVLELVAQFRTRNTETPVVLMGYANPIERMGQQAFIEAAAKAGVEFANNLQQSQIDLIFLLAPTSTPDRIRKVGQLARGYVYYVSLKGVTGAGNLDTTEVAARVAAIREHVSVPVGVGFGIRDADSARKVAECADAVVIGSKLIETMEAAATQARQAGGDAQAADQAAIQAAGQWLGQIHKALS
jgi:tryptophan synthase alpha chain